MCDLDPKVKVKKAGICNGVPSTAALVSFKNVGLIVSVSDSGIHFCPSAVVSMQERYSECSGDVTLH